MEGDGFALLERFEVPDESEMSATEIQRDAIRLMIEHKFNAFRDDLSETLPDGRRALVIDAIPQAPVDTYTLAARVGSRQYSDHSIMAARRSARGSVVSSCRFYPEADDAFPSFDFRDFNRTFGFSGQVTYENQLDQFYLPIFEGKPLERSQADRLIIADLKDGLL